MDEREDRPPVIDRLRLLVEEILWRPGLAGQPPLKAVGFYVVRMVYAVGRDIAEGQLTLRAMSLVYTTLLSLVPVLAISFSLLKGLGIHNQVEPLLLNLLAPLGEKGIEITHRIIDFVDNVKVGVLGGLGIGLLFYTVVSLMQKIERSFNYIWHVARERTFVQRFRDYLSVIVVGPTLVFSGLGLTASAVGTPFYASIARIEPLGTLLEIGARLVPYLLIVAAFTFINVFVPNTRVRLRAALIGGAVAGILWQAMGWVFASFVASSGSYAAIYSTFATLIVFLVWVYLGWLILLIGAAIAFYDQYPEQVALPRQRLILSNRTKEKLALLAATHVASGFVGEAQRPTLFDLCHKLNVPSEAVERVLDALEASGILARTADDPPRYMPARPLEQITLHRVLEAARAAEETGRLGPSRLPPDGEVDRAIAAVETATAAALDGRTLRDVAFARPAATERSPLAPVASGEEPPKTRAV